MPYFTIVVPIFRVEPYLEECLKSIQSQTFQDYEVLCMDSGSPDNSQKICRSYQSGDNRIKIIEKEDGGLSGDRNAGLDHATGSYIIFLDGDDCLAPRALADVYAVSCQKNMPDVILNRVQRYANDSKLLEEYRFFYNTAVMSDMSPTEVYPHCVSLPDFLPTAWSYVYKKDYIDDHNLRFVENLLHEDEHWNPRMMLNASSFGYNNNIFYLYRVARPGSLMNTPNIQESFDMIWIIDDLLREAELPSYDGEKKKLIKRRCSQLYAQALFRLKLYRHDSRFPTLKSQLRERRNIMLYNKSLKYNLTWLACCCMGETSTSRLLYMK